MPRQPLPRKYHGHWRIGPDELDKRPELAAIIGRCLALWSHVELQMAMLLSVLLKSDTEATISVYLTLRRTAARQDVLNAAARTVLDDAHRELFGAVMLMHQAVEAERNALAHGCFGSSDMIQDGILWIETTHHAHFLVDMWSKEPDNPTPRPRTGKEFKDLEKRLFLYKRQDLEAIYNKIHLAWAKVFDFVHYLKYHVFRSSHPETRELLFAQLCNSAPIHEYLRVQRERGSRNKPKVPLRQRLRTRPRRRNA